MDDMSRDCHDQAHSSSDLATVASSNLVGELTRRRDVLANKMARRFALEIYGGKH
mgnify:FL=1